MFSSGITLRIVLLCGVCVVLFTAELLTGASGIGVGDVWHGLLGDALNEQHNLVMREVRLPQACIAAVAGVALALSGWLMQTLFRNPLAGPSVLGISSGASLGVAVLMLSAGSGLPWSTSAGGHAAVIVAAIAGAISVLMLIMLVSQRLADNTTLLVFGIMLGFFTSAIVSALQFRASSDSVKSFALWGMGSYSEADMSEVVMLGGGIVLSGVIILFILKHLNLLLLGDDYAHNMGVPVKQTRLLILLSVGIMVGMSTAFCGPVAFIGLVVPHIARLLMHTAEHARLLVPVALGGAAASMLADLLSRVLHIPLNALVSALGAPFIIYILVRGTKSRSII
ncbi:MAG: FecCD family ABC transporter permease [Flavobacteriales bacterium]